MADVRALLKAKRQEAKITHPLATYNQAGQLRCVVCGTAVKHASAWEGHLGSKTHRTNVLALKEEQRRKEEQERLAQESERLEELSRSKRKGEESEDEGGDAKRRRVDDEDEESEEEPAAGALPAGFFSDPSKAPILGGDSDDEDQEDATAVPPPPPPRTEIDLEYERFQRELLNGPDFRETYERATVFAEPEIASETPEGFPVAAASAEEESVPPSKLSEDEQRKLKAQEERELIMDRLLDEEQAQEEADMKVSMMKARLEGLKRKRMAAKEGKKAV